MKISEKSSTVIKSLMKMGMMVTVNQVVDGDTATSVFLRASNNDVLP